MNYKLTPDQVRTIYLSSSPQAVLAERFGVGQVAISNIHVRKTWKSVTKNLPDARRAFGGCGLRGRIKLSDEEVWDIRASLNTQVEIATKHNISQCTVSFVKRRLSYQHVKEKD